MIRLILLMFLIGCSTPEVKPPKATPKIKCDVKPERLSRVTKCVENTYTDVLKMKDQCNMCDCVIDIEGYPDFAQTEEIQTLVWMCVIDNIKEDSVY